MRTSQFQYCLYISNIVRVCESDVWSINSLEEILFQCFFHEYEMFNHFCTQLGQLPPTLYLQKDNCWRENKNHYMLCFLALLVELGIFKKVNNFVILIVIRMQRLKIVIAQNALCCFNTYPFLFLFS